MIEFLPLVTLTISAAFTPGPNNIMVTASGANFGYRRSLPHLLGITIGFPAMFVAIALGFGELFQRFPAVHAGLRIMGAAFLIYLAWRIARAGMVREGKSRARPLTFIEAALFQWINPKAWVFAISALAAFTTVGGNVLAEALEMASLFLVITFAAVSTWCLFGTRIGRFLDSERALTIFNFAMAGLLAGSVALLFV